MKMFDVKIEIRPAGGVLDPQGKTVFSTLENLGFKGVKSVTAGKLIELSVESGDKQSAEKEAREMCERFLANPVIEVFSVEVQPRAEKGGG